MSFESRSAAYNVIKIGGVPIPGEIDFDAIKRELVRKTTRGAGNDGAHPRYGGLKDGHVVIRSKLHTGEDEEQWARLLPRLLNLQKAGSRSELTIDHPQFARMGITRCAVSAVSESNPKAGAPLAISIEIDTVVEREGKSGRPKKTSSGPAPKFKLFVTDTFDDLSNASTAATARARIPTALQQMRRDNGIAGDISTKLDMFPGFEQDEAARKKADAEGIQNRIIFGVL